MKYGMKMRLAWNPAMDGLDIYCVKSNEDGTFTWLETDVILEQTRNLQESSVHSMRPLLQLEREQCQQLAEALANAGYVPDSDSKIKGELEATKRHLADMQKLVFALWERESVKS